MGDAVQCVAQRAVEKDPGEHFGVEEDFLLREGLVELFDWDQHDIARPKVRGGDEPLPIDGEHGEVESLSPRRVA